MEGEGVEVREGVGRDAKGILRKGWKGGVRVGKGDGGSTWIFVQGPPSS